MADRVGQQVGNYTLARLLGEGAHTEVYLGEHRYMGTQAAIKIWDERLSTEELEAAHTEARLLGHLSHPHIIKLLEFGMESGRPFLVLNYAPNGTLRERYPRGTKLPALAILPLVKAIADALHYLHAQRIIHRNIKPNNVLIGPDDELWVSGFGIAMSAPDSPEQEVTQYGTPVYMAPEQFQGRLSYTSDQYALGVMVYEWLSGEYLFRSSSIEEMGLHHTQTPPPPLRKKDPGISPEVEAVVLKALAKNPADRFPDVLAFAQAFERAVAPERRLGNYRLTRLLGEGAFAQVYLAEHVHLGTEAAVKVLHARLAAQQQQQFKREAQTIARLEHPNIVRILDFGVEGTTPFLVMSCAPNGTLRDRHPAGTRLPLELVRSYVTQVAAALQKAHDARLIHRDVKPENMLLGRNNDVLLSDFGIAVVTSTQYQGQQNPAGTVLYMAPEQLQGEPHRSSDQYALAVVTYEWLAGFPPFQGTWIEIAGQHLHARPRPLREQVPVIPLPVEQVVLTALAKDPKDRFATVRAFAHALEQASKL